MPAARGLYLRCDKVSEMTGRMRMDLQFCRVLFLRMQVNAPVCKVSCGVPHSVEFGAGAPQNGGEDG